VEPAAGRGGGAPGARAAALAGKRWGLVRGALVYAALATAGLAGGPARGALAMLAVGAGTLPGQLGAGRVLARLETMGAPLWRRVQPAAARLAGAPGARAAALAGMLWGLLPCAMVYAALATATLAGGPARGALAMLAFGAGTLPWLLGAGALLAPRRAGAALSRLRAAAGVLVLGMGVAGLARADDLRAAVRAGLLCLT
jgi:sulfite exporter TauE/SafE